MSRINTNVSSLIAQRVLTKNNNVLNQSLERLSTGLRINKGADNPAGLIASENLRAEKTGISQAIDNAERASNIIGTAEGGLSEISNLLNELQSLVSEAANTGGLSQEEIDANQLQVDSILSTINRIAGTTAFQGKKLLNGSLDYTTSGVASTAINDLRINAAKLGTSESLTVTVQVVTSGQTANVNYTGGTTTGAVTIEVAGNLGTEQLSFASGTTTANIIAAVNALKDVTGVSATSASGGVSFNSTEYGSSQFVSIKAISGTFTTDVQKDEGQDATVLVNGSSGTANGLDVSFRSGTVDIEFRIANGFNLPGQTSFSITGGGANFSLGSKVREADKASLGISAVTTGSLGKKSIGYLDSLKSGGANSLTSDNINDAQKIVDTAIKQVAQLRGRLGAFQKFTIGSTINNLGVALENVSASESAIRDTDFAEETANLTRAQILSQAAQSVLAQANASPQAALRLLQ